MKVLIIQGPSICPGVTDDEMIERWHQLDKIPGIELTIKTDLYDRSFKGYDEVLDDYDALIGIFITKDNFRNELFDHHPHLKYVATTSHGYEEFDKEYTRKKGVTVTNTIYGDVTISQYAMALLLEICHHVGKQSQYTKNDYFNPNQKKRFTTVFDKQIELYDKTIGVIGLGSIGLWFARMASGFGAHIIAYDYIKKEGKEYDFVEQVSLDELLERSDVISLHCPLTSQTRHIINKETISKMKDGVILINTARGGLVDEEALVGGLKSRKIYAAGLDVIEDEPPKEKTPLLASPYTAVPAHIAWLTPVSRFSTVDLACENFIAYLEGHPQSVINK